MTEHNLIETLNEALGWELRAANMYAHYAANIRGIHRLQLSPMFTTEANESTMHADIVRKAIVKLGGIPVTERNSHPIIHTTLYDEMLVHSLETETKAAAVYGSIMSCVVWKNFAFSWNNHPWYRTLDRTSSRRFNTSPAVGTAPPDCSGGGPRDVSSDEYPSSKVSMAPGCSG